MVQEGVHVHICNLSFNGFVWTYAPQLDGLSLVSQLKWPFQGYTPHLLSREMKQNCWVVWKLRRSIPKSHRLESHFPINIAMFREFYGHAPNKPLKLSNLFSYDTQSRETDQATSISWDEVWLWGELLKSFNASTVLRALLFQPGIASQQWCQWKPEKWNEMDGNCRKAPKTFDGKDMWLWINTYENTIF